MFTDSMRRISGQLSLGNLGQSGESGLVVDGHLSQHLAVDLHAGQLQAVHKGGVVHAVELAGGGNAGDPQAAEITLLLLTADVSIVAGLHNSLFRHLKALALCAKIALCHLQGLFSSFAGHHRSFNTSHIFLPPYHIYCKC